MADRGSTNFARLATGDIRNQTGVQFADVPQSVRWVLGSDATAANPANKHEIRGDFQTIRIDVVVATALNASAKTINVGTDATAARFAAIAVSGGADFQTTALLSAASAAALDWQTTGSAAAVTTVKAQITDVSGVAGNAYVTYHYVQRG